MDPGPKVPYDELGFVFGMSFELGQTAGVYEFIDVMESSRHGVTYRVRNLEAQRFEALRVLPGSVQDDLEQVNRFFREANIHARIVHPNILTFYKALELDGHLAMTTELVEGATLEARLELGSIPIGQALGLASQLLAALAQAHAHEVIHRDVTPANILLTADGTLKLTGFGLAKAVTDPQLTQPGTMLGSLYYISPEQVRASSDLDARTDLYSAGIVLYQMVTGRRPFNEKSQFELMLAHVNTPPVPPKEWNPELSEELNWVILKALAKDPLARFRSAREFLGHVEGVHRVLERGHQAPPAVRTVEPAPAPRLPPLPAAISEGPSLWARFRMLAAGLFMALIAVVAYLAATHGN